MAFKGGGIGVLLLLLLVVLLVVIRLQRPALHCRGMMGVAGSQGGTEALKVQT